MTPQENTSDFWEVVVATDPTNPHGLVGRVGATQFSIGVKDGASGMSPDLDPYDLLNASLAACTAMTVRFQAQRRELSLERVEVGSAFNTLRTSIKLHSSACSCWRETSTSKSVHSC